MPIPDTGVNVNMDQNNAPMGQEAMPEEKQTNEQPKDDQLKQISSSM
jgi:hypothetical protein